MNNHQLAYLIRKLKSLGERRATEYAEPLTAAEATFLLELIQKNWRSV